MRENSNTKILKNYLVGKEGYLLNKKNYGKVIMLAGVWGSGKTYFWHDSEDSIKEELKTKKKPNIYISLYGKSSLSEIENEVFLKSYNRSNGNYDDEQNSIEKLFSTFSSTSETIDSFTGTKITPIVEYINSMNKSTKDNKAKKLMEDGLIICFDDFERKSSQVNLNDLFGFITNLSLQYKATIMIILNDDIFDGKDKKIFANLKEKTVNKFLKFDPISKELFDMIFSKYKIAKKYKTVILNTIDDLKVLNARIYKNIFENLEEYLDKNKNMTDEEIRYFVLTIINFNLNHIVFKFYDYSYNYGNDWILPSYFTELNDVPIELVNTLERKIKQNNKQLNTRLEFIDIIKSGIELKYKNIKEPDKKNEIKATEKLPEDLKKVDKYADILWLFWKLEVKMKYREEVSEEAQKSINTFIESGILVDETNA